MKNKAGRFTKGATPWNKGKTYKLPPPNEETRRKISNSLKGLKFSEERKRNISNALKGRKLTKEQRLAISKGKKGKTNAGSFKKGVVSWNKGLKGFNLGHVVSEETRRKIGKANSISQLGKKQTKETIEKRIFKTKGRKRTEEAKRKMREAKINNPNRIFRDTKIELKIEALLIENDINHQKQVPLCNVAIVDFYLPDKKLVVQCDGDYWHNRPGAQERDKRQDKVLTQNGYTVIRLWEHDINNNLENSFKQIKQYV